MDGIKIISEEKENHDGIIIPQYIVDQTLEFIRYWGEREQEALLFWAGIKNGNSTYVLSCIFPKARARALTIDTNPCKGMNPDKPEYIQHTMEPSISLSIAEAANVVSEARKRNLKIIAQVHSHEHKAYHSPIDDENPFDSFEGFLSIVIPEFGNISGDFLSSSAIYQCGADEKFHLVESQEIEKTFKVIDNKINL